MRPRYVAALAASVALVVGCGEAPVSLDNGEDQLANVVELRLDRQVINLRVGDTARIRAKYIDSYGREIDATRLRWRSSDEEVTGIESSGLLVTFTEGETEVTASGANNLTATASVKTAGNSNNSVTSIVVQPATASVAAGDSTGLSALVTYSNGATVEVRGSAKWSTSNTAVATISTEAMARGVAEGTTQVTARIRNVAGTGTINVTPPVVTTPPPTTTAPAPSAPLSPSSVAELPRAQVDVALPPVTRTIRVAAGASFQQALDAAVPGDELVLDAGATFTGPFLLRKKSGTGWITIKSSGSLPAAGTRVTPSSAPQMAKLMANGVDPVIRTEAGASGYRLIGLEIMAPTSLTMTYSLVNLGDGGSAQNSLDKQPSHLVLDRMYIHGHSNISFQRCIGLNSAYTAIIDSWISDCHAKGFDSQAIGGWNGSGPYKIVNNYLEAAGENVMFGGADPHIVNLTPSDIEIRRNHLFKPLSWKGVWTVKNIFELKHAQRVLFEDNVLENNWVDAQSGFAVLFQALSDGNSAPWTRVMDITFRHNIIRNSPSGVNVLSRVAYGPKGVMPREPSQRIAFSHNLFENIEGKLFQLLGDLRDVRLEHNTAPSSSVSFSFEGTPMQRVVIANNILGGGMFGYATGEGTASLNAFAPGATFSGNVLIVENAHVYPRENGYLRSAAEIGFIAPHQGDYRLRSNARALSGRRGAPPPGADIEELFRRTGGVVAQR